MLTPIAVCDELVKRFGETSLYRLPGKLLYNRVSTFKNGDANVLGLNPGAEPAVDVGARR